MDVFGTLTVLRHHISISFASNGSPYFPVLASPLAYPASSPSL